MITYRDTVTHFKDHESVGHLGKMRGMKAGMCELASCESGAHDEEEIDKLFASLHELTRPAPPVFLSWQTKIQLTLQEGEFPIHVSHSAMMGHTLSHAFAAKIRNGD